MKTRTSLIGNSESFRSLSRKTALLLAWVLAALTLQVAVLQAPSAFAEELNGEIANPPDEAVALAASEDNSQLTPMNDPDPFVYTTIDDGRYIIQNEDGTVLDVAGNGTEDGTNVAGWENNGSGAQRFDVAATGTDTEGNTLYTITGVESGKVLDVDGGLQEDGANVQIYESNGTAAQKWYLAATTTADGNPCLMVVSASSGKVLDVVDSTNGANVRQWTQTGGPYQHWVFLPVTKPTYGTIAEGTYVIENENGLVLDIAGGSTENGTNVQGWEYNGSYAQRYDVTSAGKDTEGNSLYTISAYESDQVVDVDGGFFADWTNVAIWESNGTAAQKWYVAPSTTADGRSCFMLISAANGKALTVGGSALGSNVFMYTQNGSGIQNWLFKTMVAPTIGTIGEGLYVIENENGLVLDIDGAGTTLGTNVQGWENNGSAAQRFQVSEAGKDENGNMLYTITANEAGLLVDVDGGFAADWTNVHIWEANGTATQKWYVAPSTTADCQKCYILISASNGRALNLGGSVLGSNAYMFAQNGLAAQNWIFKPVVDPTFGTIEEGIYIIENEGGLVLDVAGNGTTNGTNVAVWEDNGSGAQRFKVTATGTDGEGNPLYSITALESGLMLDVDGAGVTDYTNIHIWESNSTMAQQWHVAASTTADGRLCYILVSPLSGKALDVAVNELGGNVRIFTQNYFASQNWIFRPVSNPTYTTIEDGAYIIQNEGGLVLDVAGGSINDGANIQGWDDNGSGAQRFHISAAGRDDNGNTYYNIVSIPSGKVVDVAGAGAHDDTNIAIWESNGTAAQQWYLASSTTADDQKCYILISASNGKAMDLAGNITGANVRIYTQNNSAAQNWIFRLCTQSISDGAYIIESAVDSNIVIAVAAPNGDDGANIQLAEKDGSLSQAFALKYDAYSGYYTFISYASGKAMDVQGASNQESTNIWQYKVNGSAAQFWRIVENEDGSLTFVSALSPYVIDALGGIIAEGTNIQVYSSNGGGAQKFKLVATTPTLSAGSVRIQNGSDTNLAINVPNATAKAGTALQLSVANSTFSQTFVMESAGTDTYTLRPVASGLYLSANKDGAVTQEALDAAFDQKWVIVPTMDGHFTIRPAGSSNLLGCQHVALDNQILAAAGAIGASWNLVYVPLLTSGIYNIKLAANADVVLDIAGGSLENNANIGGYTANGTNAQKFFISHIADDDYNVFGAWSTLFMDVDSGYAAAGTNIQQLERNGSDAQKWTITWEDGAFIFKSALGNFALSLDGTEAGANAVLADYDITNPNQRFLLMQAEVSGIASIADLINVLDVFATGNSLKSFKSPNELSSETTYKLWKAIQGFANIGKSVGFTAIDLVTGAGVTYNSDTVYYSACSIKGPYSIALCDYEPSALWRYESDFYWALDVSDNETYKRYFYKYGRQPLDNYMAIGHVENFTWTNWTAYYTAEDLCRMWVVSQEYLLSDTEEAYWLRDVLYQNGANMTRTAVGEYRVWPVFAKSGWIDYARTEGSLVMDRHPYACGIMSNTDYSHSYLLTNLADAIYWAMQDLYY